eukprot:6176818-Amphidinium_carterae.1
MRDSECSLKGLSLVLTCETFLLTAVGVKCLFQDYKSFGLQKAAKFDEICTSSVANPRKNTGARGGRTEAGICQT